MPLKRRDWLALAAAQALGTLPLARAQSPVQFDADPFQLGIASGQPGDTSVVLWTRLTPLNPLRNAWADRSLPVAWELAADEGFGTVLRSGTVVAPPELGHSVHVDVEGLAPGTVYWYRFRVQDAVSPVGRTRTLPAAGTVAPLKLGVATCQRYHSGAFAAYRHLLADQPDLVAFLGDYIYEMGANVGESRGTWLYPAGKLADYRHLYELAKSDADLRRMHAWCPWLVTWDDHEVWNDYAGGDVRAGVDTGATARRMAMGYQAWYEHMPVSPKALLPRPAGQPLNLRVHGAYRWGDLANLLLLDARQHRTSGACGPFGAHRPGSCAATLPPERTMLGQEQEAWLTAQLQAAAQPGGAQWNFLLQPLVFSRFLIPAQGGLVSSDNWDGYPQARKRLLDTIATAKPRNPVVFGGDIHQNWVAHVSRDPEVPGGAPLLPEFCSTSISTPSFGPVTAAEMKALAPDCLYTDRHLRGYTLAEVGSDRLTVSLRTLPDLHARPHEVRTAARFEVAAGSPTIRQVA